MISASFSLSERNRIRAIGRNREHIGRFRAVFVRSRDRIVRFRGDIGRKRSQSCAIVRKPFADIERAIAALLSSGAVDTVLARYR
ncbi:MAG: hypothetical protein V4582_23400 [Pseudomonadota bacterium]